MRFSLLCSPLEFPNLPIKREAAVLGRVRLTPSVKIEIMREKEKARMGETSVTETKGK